MFEEHSMTMRKFLIAVVYRERTYYTVHGMDFTVTDVNINNHKVLVTEDDKWRLCSSKTDLAAYITQADHLWDAERMKEWAKGVDERAQADTEINLDFMLTAKDDVNDYYELYNTMIFVEDFVEQIDDVSMHSLTLGSSTVREFFDAAADYFLWKDGDKEMLAIRGPRLLLAINNIYMELQKWIEV